MWETGLHMSTMSLFSRKAKGVGETVYCVLCREAVSNNLTLAVAPDDFKNESELGPADFLIRGIPGMDPKGGAIAVAEAIGIGKRIRFMVSNQQASVHLLN